MGLGRILSEHQRRELEKRVIGEEILSNWLHRKQLEEEVMTEMFGEEMLQRVKNSIASENPEVTSDTCNKSPTDLQKIIHIQDKGEDSGLVPHLDGPMSLNGQERIDQSPVNEKEGGLTGSIPIQRPPRAPNTTKPGMFIGLGRTATTQSELTLDNFIEMQKGEGSSLVLYAQDPAFLNGQSPVNDTDSGLNCSLPFQRFPRAPNNTNPEKLVDLGKEATTPLVNSDTKRTSEGELNVDPPPIGGDNETAGKTTAKRKRWDCDLCCVMTNAESVLQAHLKGKKHLAKLKASSETAKPPTSGEDHGKSIQEDNLPK
uniref:C2H2-type domain-containing protein n=1 Tax=Daucus carota subsp. sativus TaxID=79200 RepID=A0A164XHV9_DAUCS